MPTKKVTAIAWDDVRQVQFACPYCNADNYGEWCYDQYNEEEYCIKCDKKIIVEIK